MAKLIVKVGRILCLLSFAIALVAPIQAQAFTAFTLKSRLPAAAQSMSSAYDGQDFIYLLGGVNPSFDIEDIIRYSTMTDNAVTIAETLPSHNGVAAWAGKCIYYASQGYVWKLDPNSSQKELKPVKVGSVRDNPTAAVWDKGEYIYFIGGGAGNDGDSKESASQSDKIYQFSTLANKTTQIGVLPYPMQTPNVVLDTSWTAQNMYIFGSRTFPSRHIIKYEIVSGTFSFLSLQLPMKAPDCVVWTGTYIYVFGRFREGGKTWQAARWDPAMDDDYLTPVNLRNFPDGLSGQTCVYVPKLHRIYVFGGVTRDGGVRDQIMYMDLNQEMIDSASSSTQAPETTTTLRVATDAKKAVSCHRKEDGAIIPDPYCCKSFYQCYDGHEFMYECPKGLHFSPTLARCVYAPIAGCGPLIKY